MSETEITDNSVKLPRWLAVAVVIGAFTLGAITVEARIQLGNVKDDLGRIETKQNTHIDQPAHPLALERITRLEAQVEEAKRDDKFIRDLLGKIQLNQAAICQATKAECNH